jgi:hypothetical protein
MGWGDGVNVDFDPLDFFELCTVVGRATKGAATIKTFPGSSVKVHAQESWNVFNVERMVMFVQFYYLHFRILKALSSFN